MFDATNLHRIDISFFSTEKLTLGQLQKITDNVPDIVVEVAGVVNGNFTRIYTAGTPPIKDTDTQVEPDTAYTEGDDSFDITDTSAELDDDAIKLKDPE